MARFYRAFQWQPQDLMKLSAYGGKEYIIAREEEYQNVEDPREAVDDMIRKVEAEVSETTKAMVEGRLSIKEWQTEMISKIKYSFAVAGAIEGNLDERNRQYQTEIYRQLGYLGRFGIELQDGKQGMNMQTVYRARMYINAARQFYEDNNRTTQYRAGMKAERRILYGGDDNSFCKFQHSKGWVPILTLPRIGEGELGTMCTCSFEFRKKAL